MPQLTAAVDHVAIAVPDLDAAQARWRDELGGRPPAGVPRRGPFRSLRLRYRNDATLELIAPGGPGDHGEGAPDLVGRFLDEHGSDLHHLTLVVPDLAEAASLLRDVGLDVIDHVHLDEAWHGLFLRPSQIGGILVQLIDIELARPPTAGDDEDAPAPKPPLDGAHLQGPLLRHPYVEQITELWRLLGAAVTPDAGGVTCRWGQGTMTVRVVPGSNPGRMGLRFSGAPPLPPDEQLGPAVIPAEE